MVAVVIVVMKVIESKTEMSVVRAKKSILCDSFCHHRCDCDGQ